MSKQEQGITIQHACSLIKDELRKAQEGDGVNIEESIRHTFSRGDPLSAWQAEQIGLLADSTPDPSQELIRAYELSIRIGRFGGSYGLLERRIREWVWSDPNTAHLKPIQKEHLLGEAMRKAQERDRMHVAWLAEMKRLEPTQGQIESARSREGKLGKPSTFFLIPKRQPYLKI